MRKKTLKQKMAEHQPHETSKYARKAEKRRKLAKKLKSEVLPLPVLLAEE
jgi:hypothetical protein